VTGRSVAEASLAVRSIQRVFAPLHVSDQVFSSFELWPWYVFYLPLAVQWAALSLRHRGLTLPTVGNPCMPAGGLCGESKVEILSQLGREGRKWLAPYTSLTVASASGSPRSNLAQALAALETAAIEFPFVAKPDIGCRGSGVRVIATVDDLAAYLAVFPRGERVIFQQLVADEGEAGVFYIRRPGEASGRVFSLTLKYFPFVVGDGRSTLEQLIQADPRASRIAPIYLKRHAGQRSRVLASGETFRLVFAGNHCRGAVFRNGIGHVTPAMTARFDAIAQGMPEFYFGRFDVRFASLADFKRGENFTLIEVNGAGSEAVHIWDRTTRLLDAYKTLFEQHRLLFEISAENRRRGCKPMGVFRLLRLYARQLRLMARYPLTS
jgi:hypothetical protein